MRHFLVGFFLLMVTACSSGVKVTPRPEGDVPLLPFQLAVKEEHFDGSRLAVEAELNARRDWDANKIVLQLRRLQDGHELGREQYLLTDVISSEQLKRFGDAVILPADSTHHFTLIAPALGATDYELRLIWGDEAHAAMAAVKPALPLRFREIKVTRLAHGCDEVSLCPVEFDIEGQLTNSSAEIVENATITVSWAVPVDFEAAFPQNSIENQIGGLGLSPGAQRTVRFTIAERFPKALVDRVSPSIVAAPLP